MSQAAIQRSKAFKEQEDTYSSYRADFMIKVFSFVIQPEHERKAYVIKYIRGENVSGLKDDNALWS